MLSKKWLNEMIESINGPQFPIITKTFPQSKSTKVEIAKIFLQARYPWYKRGIIKLQILFSDKYLEAFNEREWNKE